MMAMQARLLLAIVLSLLLVHGVVGQAAFPARSQKPQQTRRQQIAERQNREMDAMIVDHHHTDYRRQTVTNFQCTKCVKEADGVTPRATRVMYLDALGITENKAARAKAKELNREYSCDDPKLATPECFNNWQNWRNGWVGILAGNIFEKLDLNITVMTRANFTAASAAAYQGASSFTRCAWEVKLRKVDICVSNFWETPERRSLVSFTASMSSDVMRLGTLSLGISEEFTGKDLLAIFDPFSPEVWAVNIAMIFVASFFIWLVEVSDGSDNNEDYVDQTIEGRQLTKVEGFTKSIWLAMLGYVSGGVAHTSTGWAGRFIVLGFGWFVYISVSSYTANLASFMISTVVPLGLISTYGDIPKKAGSLCGLEALSGMVNVAGMKYVGFDDYIPAIEGMYDKRCLGVMVGKAEWTQMVRAHQGESYVCTDPKDTKKNSACADPNGTKRKVQLSTCTCKDSTKLPQECPKDCPDHLKYCGMMEILDPTFQYSVGFALPVVEWLEQYVSAWIIHYKASGSVLQHISDSNDAFPSLCQDSEGGDEGGGAASPLGIKSMAGTFVISMALMLTGLVIHLIQFIRRRRHPELRVDPEKMHFVNGHRAAITGSFEHVNQIHSSDVTPRPPVDSGEKIQIGRSGSGPGSTEVTTAKIGFFSGNGNCNGIGTSEKLEAQQKQLDAISQQIADLKPMAAQIRNQQAKFDAMFDLIASMSEQHRNSESQSARAPSINVTTAPRQLSVQAPRQRHPDKGRPSTPQATNPIEQNPFAVFLTTLSGGPSRTTSVDTSPSGLV